MAARYGLTDLVEILPNNAKKLLYLWISKIEKPFISID